MVPPAWQRVLELGGKVRHLYGGRIEDRHNLEQTKCEICIFLFHFMPF